jgi:F420-non-reducing hydrogenase iron-sulfur subunit
MHYPPNVKVVRVMCTGRVNPLFVVQALREGADGILVSG